MAVIGPSDGVRTPSEEKRSRLPLFLWIATGVFIVYGTTIPFHFVPDVSVAADHLARLRLNPLISPDTGRRVSGPDFISNVWLFTPFGCFGIWALRRPRSYAVRIAALTVLSAALSVGVELLQLFTTDRVSSFADVFANTSGGAIGAVGGMFFRSTALTLLNAGASSGLIESASFFPFLVATLLMCAGAWEPFDVTIDVGSVIPKLRNFFHDPFQFGPWSDEGVSLLQHALFTATFVVWLKELRVRTAVFTAVVVGATMAAMLEGSQIVIGSRMPGVWDGTVAVIGALIGVAIGAAYARRSFWPGWPVALIGATAVGAAIQQLSPFIPVVGEPRPFQWVPFLNYYELTTTQTVSHSAELLLTYLPLGFGLAAAASDTKFKWLLPLALTLAIAAPVEYLQRFVGGRYPDITDIAMSTAGGWIGAWVAIRGWRLFATDMRVISSHPAAAGASSRRRASPAPDLP